MPSWAGTHTGIVRVCPSTMEPLSSAPVTLGVGGRGIAQ